MALSQVRVQLNGEWKTLTFSEAANAYIGDITPGMTSRNQPGGYFEVTVEASTDGDEVTTASQKLIVTEDVAPVISLVSPAQGYLTVNLPEITIIIADEPNGSGVNPDTVSARLDGVLANAAEITVTAVSGGYSATYAPTSPLADGAHMIAFSAEDYDGNTATLALQYTVDTTPPVMYIVSPGFHRVVDDASVVIRGYASDETAPDVTVAITNNGQAYAPAMDNGAFTREIPLDIGVNNIEVTATDGAGLTTTVEIYMIRLVTDRAQSDVDYLRGLYMQYDSFEDWPEDAQAWFLETVCLRGSYDAADWNRVGAAVEYLSSELEKRGYVALVEPKTDWSEYDNPTRGPMEIYRKNVVTIRDAQPGLVSVPLPETMRRSGIEDWNNIEKALVAIDALFDYYRNWQSGEIFAGEM